MATMQEIADSIGVSRVHVSRALHDSGYVKASLKRRILRRAEEMGYRPHHPAKALASRRSMDVGMFLEPGPGFFNQHLPAARLATTFADCLERHGYKLKLLSNQPDPDVDGYIVPFLAGLDLICPDGWPLRPTVALVSGLPANIERVQSLGIPYVSYLHRPGIDSLAALLAARGLRRCCVLTLERPQGQGEDPRLDIVRDAFDEAGLSLGPDDIFCLERAPQQLTADILATIPRLRRYQFCLLRSEPVAVCFYQAAAIAGLEIPSDLSVAGFDPATSTAAMQPGLSSLDYSIDDVCQVTVDSLLASLQGHGQPPGRELPTGFVDRGSIR